MSIRSLGPSTHFTDVQQHVPQWHFHLLEHLCCALHQKAPGKESTFEQHHPHSTSIGNEVASAGASYSARTVHTAWVTTKVKTIQLFMRYDRLGWIYGSELLLLLLYQAKPTRLATTYFVLFTCSLVLWRVVRVELKTVQCTERDRSTV